MVGRHFVPTQNEISCCRRQSNLTPESAPLNPSAPLGTIGPDDRTTAQGLFNYARSYWQSGEVLLNAKLNVTHPDAPITFLFYHAIELYLKAFLRAAGKSVSDVKAISHHIVKIAAEAQKLGLLLDEEDMQVINLMHDFDNVVRSRYIVTGAFSRPAEDALSRTCNSLDQLIVVELRKRNVSVRTVQPRGHGPPHIGSDLADIEYDLDYLNDTEREIIAYLLAHGQRMFTAALDGGHAATLISRGIVRKALQPGQVFNGDDVPMEVPKPVWELLQSNRSKFPYGGEKDDPYPWRVGWNERL